MPRHPPIALKTLDHSHCQCPSHNSIGVDARARSCAGPALNGIGIKRPASRDLIEGAVRQPIICGRLSVSPRQTRAIDMQINLAGRSLPGDRTQAMEFEQIFSLRCQTEQAASRSSLQTLLANDHFPSQHQVMVEPDGIEPTTSCLQSRRSPS